MPYLVAYAVPGLLLAIAAGFHAPVRLDKLLIRSAIVIVFWPLLILLNPAFFSRPPEHEDVPTSRNLESIHGLGSVLEADLAALSDEERLRVERTQRIDGGNIAFFSDSTDFGHVLHRLWEDAIPPEAYRTVETARRRIEHDFDDEHENTIRFSRSEPDWYIGFSVEFVRSIAKLDKNKRARLLEVISNLAAAPTTPHGDTVKPLTGQMTGLWRYRLGDDRLIYKPDLQSKRVTLISFGARGDIY